MKSFFAGLIVAFSLFTVSSQAQLMEQLSGYDPYSLAKFPPQTGSERFHDYLRDSFTSPGAYLAPAGAALIGQASNEPEEWHRTIEGYGKRYGTDFARFTIQNTVRDGGAAALGYETRYFRCGCSGFLPRTGHAIKMTLFTYNHNGHLTVDIPQLAGAYGSGMITTIWYPDHYSPLVQGVQTGHIQIGAEAGLHLVQEFSPELKRMFHIGRK